MANPTKVADLMKTAVGEGAFQEIRARRALREIRESLKHPSDPEGLAGLFARIERQVAVGLGERDA
jgi:hypothetical protein